MRGKYLKIMLEQRPEQTNVRVMTSQTAEQDDSDGRDPDILHVSHWKLRSPT